MSKNYNRCSEENKETDKYGMTDETMLQRLHYLIIPISLRMRNRSIRRNRLLKNKIRD